MAKKINYSARNFNDFRNELISYARQNYPEVINDFNDASIGMLLIELNAGIGDALSFNLDRVYQETTIDYSQETKSLMNIARTYGLKIPGNRPSVTLLDISVIVPVNGDTFDKNYLPIIRKGAQFAGGGNVFELDDDTDFGNPFNANGFPNRLIEAIADTNGLIQSYKITKREIAKNGITKVQKYALNNSAARPFFDIVLPDNNVLSIEGIINLEGTNYNNIPSDTVFNNEDFKWYEVNALAEDKIFIETSRGLDGFYTGKWMNVDKRFITEFTDKNFCRVIFGGGMEDLDSINEFIDSPLFVNRIDNIVNNLSLGQILKPNSTLFIKYRIGGGPGTNIGPNTVKTFKQGIIDVSGPQSSVNNAVMTSITVNNPIPALGGTGQLSTEQIRNLIRYNFSAQNRCVTIPDYYSRIMQMPGKFGTPYAVGVSEEQNKIKVSVINLGEDGKLKNQNNSVIKENIAEYLSDFRMINDYVEVADGRIYHLEFEIDLFVDKAGNKTEILTNTIKTITDFLDINKQQMGDNIFISKLINKINDVPNVLNISRLDVFNKVGDGIYSLNEVPQAYSDELTRKIDLTDDYILYNTPDGLFEIKQPNRNIKVRLKN